MRKSILVLALLPFVWTTNVYALALTDINLSSGINESLDARIPLRALQPNDMETIRIKLADTEHFTRANLERLPILDDLRFEAFRSPNGSAYIRITTDSAVNEPFLSFIVEVSWSRGRILREYTLLLDPPTYTGAASAAVREAETNATKAIVAKEIMDRTAASRTETSSMASVASTTSAATMVDEAGGAYSVYGPVTAEDTLWSIATRSRPDKSVSIEQMMLALRQHNPDAFVENNINALKAGAILRIPDRGKTMTIPQKEALAEVKRQHVVWEAFRQRLAVNPTATPSGSPVPSTEAKSDSTEAGRSGRIEILSAGAAVEGVGQTGKDDAKKLRAEIAMAKEDIDAKGRENKELRSRIAEAEDLIQEFVHLMEIQSDEINALKRKLAETGIEIPSKAPPAKSRLLASESEASTISRTIPPQEKESKAPVSETGKITETTSKQDAQSSSSPISEPLSEILVPTKPSLEDASSEPDSKPQGFSLMDRIHDYLIIIVAGLGAILILIAGRVLWLRRRREIAEGRELDSAEGVFRSSKLTDSGGEIKGSSQQIPPKQKERKQAEVDTIPGAEPDVGEIASLGADFSKVSPPVKVTGTRTTEGENMDLGFGFELDSDPSRESPKQKDRKAKTPDFPPPEMSGDTIDEIQTKLDLAQAYIDMGDAEGARNILTQVLEKGSKIHKNTARELLEKLG
uniref:FimV N-terminal domain-containing protein n=1 Tax=Candidatus Kentrum sp. LPFa TaxID=2126335 RepID=A0A450XIN8_9GAMM|nr:MAG: FimV N-terminal domain-containing protein [Candidatus Kentron sp. LPFa]VFK29099.1 MAG: FimV N-terminal domain-containing protein [Candidatus Kentron sp. LPFa]